MLIQLSEMHGAARVNSLSYFPQTKSNIYIRFHSKGSCTVWLISIWNCDGVVLDIYLDDVFQWPQEGLNWESLLYNVAIVG